MVKRVPSSGQIQEEATGQINPSIVILGNYGPRARNNVEEGED